MQSIAPNLYTLEGLNAGRVYLIEDPDGLTLIDASLAVSGQKIIAQITASGRKPSDIKRVLLTHAQPDHIGGVPVLKAQSGAQIICSEAEKSIAEGKVPEPRPVTPIKLPDHYMQGITIDRTVKDGDMIEAFGGLQVIATPGSTPGHICFWQPERKILFLGDVLMNLFGLRFPPGIVVVDKAAEVRSLKRIALLDIQIACFGHGQPITQNAAASIRAFANAH